MKFFIRILSWEIFVRLLVIVETFSTETYEVMCDLKFLNLAASRASISVETEVIIFTETTNSSSACVNFP